MKNDYRLALAILMSVGLTASAAKAADLTMFDRLAGTGHEHHERR
jgi:hypothetical protein